MHYLTKYKAANKNERGEIKVCKAFDDWSKELHDEGIEEGRIKTIVELIKKGLLSMTDGAGHLCLGEEELKQYL